MRVSTNEKGGIMPEVSIIVPVYNAEKAAGTCIRSVLCQEYQDFELILVDDGSTDQTPALLDRYASEDGRVKVIHRKNSGVSAARNAGLDAAEGRYIQFLDADDWITKDSTKLLVRTMEEKNCDMVVAAFYRVIGENCSCKSSISAEKAMTRQEYADHMMESPADYYYGVLWNKLYKNEIIRKNKIRMDETVNWSEDFLFNLEYVLHASRIASLGAPVYYYVKTDGSLVSQGMNLNRIIQMKTSTFQYYNEFYRSILDEDKYSQERLNIARYLIDPAQDDSVVPFAPGTKKLGEETVPVYYTTGENNPVITSYYLTKAFDRFLNTAAMKNGLELNDMKIIAASIHSEFTNSQRDLSDMTGIPQLSILNTARKLMTKNLLDLKIVSTGLATSLTEQAGPVAEDIEKSLEDLESVMFREFSEEEKQKAKEVLGRINRNLRAFLAETHEKQSS